MDVISKPMLACGLETDDLAKLKYPVAATPKLDGIRCLKPDDDRVLTRSFKPIPNEFIRTTLMDILPAGADGEIMAGGNFQEVTHAVMGHESRPDFVYCMFDYVSDSFKEPYVDRMEKAKSWWNRLPEEKRFRVRLLMPTPIHDVDELLVFERHCITNDYEGIIVRDPLGPYKNGRSTRKEGWLLKFKRFVDAEATVVGFEELTLNGNVKTYDAFGHAQHSSHKENLVPMDTLGALVLEDEDGKRFNVGTGFDCELRRKIWADRDRVLGATVKYKYFPVGVKELPRHPVFLGFRDAKDMS
jgi:DNA ligase-1